MALAVVVVENTEDGTMTSVGAVEHDDDVDARATRIAKFHKDGGHPRKVYVGFVSLDHEAY